MVHLCRQILDDLEIVRLYSLDFEMFCVVYSLFTRKWIEEYQFHDDELKTEVRKQIKYISDTWALDRNVCNWFEGACPLLPSTNNSLEANNSTFKTRYTDHQRHSINVITDKIGQYLNDQADLKKEDDEPKHSNENMKVAERFLTRNTEFFVSRDLTRSSTNHRTMVRQDYGEIRGRTKKIVAVPTLDKPQFSANHFKQLAATNLMKRTSLDYDNFDDFKKCCGDLYFIEYSFINDTDCFTACSCVQSIKGKPCIHELAVLMNDNYISKPSEIPRIGRLVKKRGPMSKNRRQRFV